MIGGTSSVDRKNGDTFRIEINTAMASTPDALGIISWNEFSENSYIEPSQKYGSQYLDLLSQILKTPATNVIEFDSSIPDKTYSDIFPQSHIIALGGLGVLVIISMVMIFQHQIRLGR
jgi:hypothetical protein